MDQPIFHEIRRFESLDSTNQYALTLSETLLDGTVILADYQTAGRGTVGRTWISNKAENLLFSLVLKQSESFNDPLLSHKTALSIQRALSSYNLSVSIKWPNDILVDAQKIAGILIERNTDCAVVGIGLNVNQVDFPMELRMPATSMVNLTHKKTEPIAVLMRILDEMEEVFAWETDQVVYEYNQRLFQKGKALTVNPQAGFTSLLVSGIDESGALYGHDEQNLPRSLHSAASLVD